MTMRKMQISASVIIGIRKENLGVTLHFSEIIQLPFEKNGQNVTYFKALWNY